jgi:hypothetical protein
MRTLCTMAILAAAVGAASAQDTRTTDERVIIKRMLSGAEVLGAKGGFLGATVKGAPYSGEEISESTQVLADGTRIHNETHTNVYRDGEGRIRRESPDSISIWDPVANASYFLNPKDMTYEQMPLAVQYFSSTLSKGAPMTVRVSGGAMGSAAAGGIMMAPPPAGLPPSGKAAFIISDKMDRITAATPGENLGKQTIEGVSAEGTRHTNTIETGAIGNDRPIQITAERWYSPDLQTVVLSKHSDPRTGEEDFRLVNINRGDQPASLFQVPAGYQKMENK